MDWKLELVAVPVSDVDRAKAFYTEKVGFNADHDHQVSEQLRFVQLTPRGSACSIAIGTGIVDTPPGSVHGLQLVVQDVRAARVDLVERGWRRARSRTCRGGRSSSSAIRTATAGPCSRSLPAGSRGRWPAPCRC
jgi:catechol 2,3-dioxygenase-like lactoylglutathione lyase family enzyme